MYEPKHPIAGKKTLDDMFSESKRFLSGYNEYSEAIIDEMNRVRKIYDISSPEFSHLLGINSKQGWYNIRASKNVNLQTVLTFCYLFGYDLTALVLISSLSQKQNIYFREAILSLSRCSRETLESVIETIRNSSENEASKSAVEAALQHIIDSQREKEKTGK